MFWPGKYTRQKTDCWLLSPVWLCDPTDCSPPCFSIQGISQARVLEWIATSLSRGSSQPGIEPRVPASHADSLISKTEWKFGKHSHADISERINFQILNFQTHAQLKILLDCYFTGCPLFPPFLQTPLSTVFMQARHLLLYPRWESSGVHHSIISRRQCRCPEWVLT